MKASILLTLAVSDTEVYEVNLNIPTSVPTKEAPFTFNVAQLKNELPADKVLDVALGDSSNIYVAVAPPKSLIQEVGVDKIVKNLEVVVQEGNYDPVTGTFK